MTDPTWLFIVGCWMAWLAYWLIMAFATKRTVERGGFVGYRLVAGLLVVGLLIAGHLVHLFAGICGALWWKARDEERTMSQHFPDAYAEYKARVAAIIPFVL